jgi:hypothetical protein
METVRDDPSMNRTFAVRRKAAMRTFPWKLTAEELQLALPRTPDEDEDIRATKRPRLEEPVPTSIDEDATEKTSHATTVALSAAATAADSDASDPVMDMHPNVMTTGAYRHWTPEEDAKLTSAVTDTCKIKWGKEFKTDWVAIAALVPDRTGNACKNRWRETLNPNIDRANGRRGKWEDDEDIKLKNAVRTHGGNDWPAIAELVPGRTRTQCYMRWHNILDPSIDRTPGCSGKWTTGEDIKLKDAVRAHGAKNWVAIAAVVPGRNKNACYMRWHIILDPSIDRTPGCSGKWTAGEDIKLKDAVKMYDGKNWDAIASLVPGRTRIQCVGRWRYALA